MIAGALMFILNRNICNTFYICDRASHREFHGVTVLLAEAAEFLARRGFRYLDLGPSASSDAFQSGCSELQRKSRREGVSAAIAGVGRTEGRAMTETEHKG